jgi:adenylate cyclase
MVNDHLSRKLAVLLHADVVGSTSLVQKNETLAHERIQDIFRRFSETISSYGGVALEIRGDALVAEFAKVSDAVSASLVFQAANNTLNQQLSDDIRPILRIGIAMGEVVVADNTVTGEGIVLAQRLEQLAEPGGVCIQGAAYETLPKRLPFEYENLGEQQVKGFDEPVRVYAVGLKIGAALPEPQTVVRPETLALDLPEKPSIAVLPFTNMSGDPEQEYFSDGITEDIITALSRLRSLFVIARNTTFTYRGHAVDVQAVAKNLGVRYVLEGSVRRAGNEVRISAQLIDGESGNHIWGEKYDREVEDVFAVQDEITQTVVGAVQPELGRFEQDRARRKPPDRLDAWDLLQRGIWHYWRREKDDADKAEELILSAIELDPSFSPAYASLCEVYYINLYHGWTDTPEETLDRALKAGRKAVSLDDKDADAHFALGRAHTLQGDYEPAIAELEKALSFNPNFAFAYYGLGMALYRSGRAREALPFAHKAIRQSPNDPLKFGFEGIIGSAHFQLGEYIEALEWCKRASRHPTSSFWTHTYLALALIKLNQIDSARVALNDALRKQPDLSLTSFSEMLKHLHPAYRENILVGLREAGLPK